MFRVQPSRSVRPNGITKLLPKKPILLFDCEVPFKKEVDAANYVVYFLHYSTTADDESSRSFLPTGLKVFIHVLKEAKQVGNDVREQKKVILSVSKLRQSVTEFSSRSMISAEK